MDALIDGAAIRTLDVRGQSFHIHNHPVVIAGATEFAGGFEEGTLRFFDAALPRCDRMIDCGAYIGFTTLYAASHGVGVTAFEPSAVNFQFLSANVTPTRRWRRESPCTTTASAFVTNLRRCTRKGYADSGSSVFQVVERGRAIAGRFGASVELRAAAEVLLRAGLNARTLLKIDIEGAEYAVLPAIADLLAEHKPWLHVSFHPFISPPNATRMAPRSDACVRRSRWRRRRRPIAICICSPRAPGAPSARTTGWVSCASTCCSRKRCHGSRPRNSASSTP